MEEKADDYLKMEKNVLEKNINRKEKGGKLWIKENILIVEEEKNWEKKSWKKRTPGQVLPIPDRQTDGWRTMKDRATQPLRSVSGENIWSDEDKKNWEGKGGHYLQKENWWQPFNWWPTRWI